MVSFLWSVFLGLLTFLGILVLLGILMLIAVIVIFEIAGFIHERFLEDDDGSD